MLTLYTVFDRLRETSVLLQEHQLVEYFAGIEYSIDEKEHDSISDIVFQLKEYDRVIKIYGSFYQAGPRWFASRHILEV